MHDTTDTAEDPGDDAVLVGGEGRVGGRDDGHGFSYDGRRVGHDADDPAAVLALDFVQGGRCAVVEDRFDLVDRDAGEDGDQEFSGEGFAHAGCGEDVRNHLGFASEEDDVGGGDGGDVVVLHDGDGVVGVLR